MNSFPLSFIPLARKDFPLIHRWFQEPHLWKWWGEGKKWSLEDIENKYCSYVEKYKMVEGQQKSIYPFIIQFQGQPIGYIQFYNAFDFKRTGYSVHDIAKDETSLAALDFYIGEPSALGKGMGSQILSKFLQEEIFRHFEACLVDPDRKNKSAIQAYSKAGFTTRAELNECIVMIAKKKPTQNPIVILGTSRRESQTKQAIAAVLQDQIVPIVDLMDYNISYYDYEYRNRSDDFIPLAEQMIRHNPIILATPVYWYTMSAIMKNFIDRWSDLLDIRKDIGRRLAGKELYVITTYANSYPKEFESVFSQTCEYLEMAYKGCYYFYSGDNPHIKSENLSKAQSFAKNLFHA